VAARDRASWHTRAAKPISSSTASRSGSAAAAPGIVRPLVPLQPAGIVESGFCLHAHEIAGTGQSTSSKADAGASAEIRENRLFSIEKLSPE
jgi:hypothetical protein